MMENHGYSQVIGNPNNPFVNKLAKSANTAHNYFAIAHPSLTNYLEIVGGSNLGIHTVNSPDSTTVTAPPTSPRRLSSPTLLPAASSA
jgi:phosphatidylinositol-3-phosphatase